MAIITLPSISARSTSLRLVRGDSALEFFSGASVIVQSTKAIWILSFPLNELKLADARVWTSALVQLAKLDNQFQVTPPGWSAGAGYGGSNPLVNGAAQLGTTLVCDGATASSTVALEGDFISVNGEFKCLTQQADSDPTTNVTFNFEPALRASPTDGASVEVINPIITMRMLQPDALWVITPPVQHTITINAVEHFGP